MSFKLATDYIDVAQRIADFREKYPQGCLRTGSIDFREFAGACWVIYSAEAYRWPGDPLPAQGTAWEQVPGKTPYTKDSELQNAETAAWGRAIVAALAADTRKGIASTEEIRNREAEREAEQQRLQEMSQAVKAEIAQATSWDELNAIYNRLNADNMAQYFTPALNARKKALEQQAAQRENTPSEPPAQDGEDVDTWLVEISKATSTRELNQIYGAMKTQGVQDQYLQALSERKKALNGGDSNGAAESGGDGNTDPQGS